MSLLVALQQQCRGPGNWWWGTFSCYSQCEQSQTTHQAMPTQRTISEWTNAAVAVLAMMHVEFARCNCF